MGAMGLKGIGATLLPNWLSGPPKILAAQQTSGGPPRDALFQCLLLCRACGRLGTHGLGRPWHQQIVVALGHHLQWCFIRIRVWTPFRFFSRGCTLEPLPEPRPSMLPKGTRLGWRGAGRR